MAYNYCYSFLHVIRQWQVQATAMLNRVQSVSEQRPTTTTHRSQACATLEVVRGGGRDGGTTKHKNYEIRCEKFYRKVYLTN